MLTSRRTKALTAGIAALLVTTMAACSPVSASPTPEPATSEEAASNTTVEVTDNFGTHTITLPVEKVVATDNRTFGVLDEWGVELVAAARALMAPSVAYADNDDIVDLGNHREPNLEAIAAVQPDVIVNGQRFAQYQEDFAKLVPDAVILNLDPREGEPFDAELKRQVEVLGVVFGHEDEAAALIADFEASIARVKAAYDPSETVMGVITSGGNINYAAPSTGRTLGPVFDVLGLTPALEVEESSTDHEGDDISVEAIAQSNPDWILVMDRDAAVGAEDGETYVPANELLANSAALTNVTAVSAEQIVYMPKYTYLDEGIRTYTDFFNSIADAMEKN